MNNEEKISDDVDSGDDYFFDRVWKSEWGYKYE